MATKKKLLQAAAGSAGGEALNIEDVFSTYLYDGTGSAQTITNGIDLDGEGGLVWTKARNANAYHALWDTERGANRAIFSHLTNAESNFTSNTLTSFNSDGFSLGTAGIANDSDENYASWTFRKAEKFFTCLTYSGTGPGSAANEQQVSHDLGAKPGIVIIKRTDATGDWWVFTDVIDGSNDYGYLNQTAAFGNSANNVATDSVFSVGGVLNTSGASYVAYLFAHNDGDGEFGPDGDADIIKCGSYTGTGAAGHFIDLGFEPQWLMIKRTDSAASWEMLDVMRGMPAGGEGSYLRADKTNAEATSSNHSVTPSPTGFTIDSTSNINGNNDSFIYMAIRRGPMAVPEDADDVFAIDARNSSEPHFTSGFPIDMAFYKSTSGSSGYVSSRITGLTEGELDTTAAFGSATAVGYDKMTGFLDAAGDPGANYYAWMWKRAPGYFDAQAFTLGSASNREVKHNLAAVPEMIWWKERSGTSYWMFWHKSFTSSQYMSLHLSDAIATSTNIWGTSAPTSTGWYMKETAFGSSGNTCISYTFASVDGVSKVGSYTGNGSSQTIDCGFTAGARFIIIKNTEQGRGWVTIDTERGLAVGDDKVLYLNATNAQSDLDYVDPHSSGFTLSTSNDQVNANGKLYIFYAIA